MSGWKKKKNIKFYIFCRSFFCTCQSVGGVGSSGLFGIYTEYIFIYIYGQKRSPEGIFVFFMTLQVQLNHQNMRKYEGKGKH